MISIKIHGRGNAWPVPLGEEHPFYDRTNPADLANAAYSLIFEEKGVRAEILIDAGHGTIQSLILGDNRIPDLICLTHGHMDHTVSVDWVVQSYWSRHNKEKKYPLYSSTPVYRFLVQSFPHLEKLIEHHALVPGEKTVLPGLGVELNFYPVYHGQSAFGAGMLLFTYRDIKILFTGDLLFPLLRDMDYEYLRDIDLMVIDGNNRFPYPGTNHWSITGDPGIAMSRNKRLTTFIKELDLKTVLKPHDGLMSDDQSVQFFKSFEGFYTCGNQPFTVFEFAGMILPRKTMLVHYSGREDEKYYHQSRMNDKQLSDWVNIAAKKSGIPAEFIIPEPAGIYSFT